MNKYDQYFDFRIATKDDVDAIMMFLKENWGKNHILAHNRELFLWQYGNEEYGDDNQINFVLMQDKKKNIVGINGFVQYSNDVENKYVSYALTKVKDNVTVPMSGVELMKRFEKLVPAKAYYNSGANSKTIVPLFDKIFKYKVGKMKQFYILNPQMKQYKIAEIKQKYQVTMPSFCMVELIKIENMKVLECIFDFSIPYDKQAYKSKEYISKRFFQHPIYQYTVYGVVKEKQNKIDTIIVCREVEVEERKALRIVDVLGDITNLKYTYLPLTNLLGESGYEYVDLLISNLDHQVAVQGGWTLRKEEDVNIIPTYFEPYLHENIDIWFEKSREDITIFKADGDQDRPNIYKK